MLLDDPDWIRHGAHRDGGSSEVHGGVFLSAIESDGDDFLSVFV